MITIRQILQTSFTIAGLAAFFFSFQLGATLWIIACLLDIADEINKLKRI